MLWNPWGQGIAIDGYQADIISCLKSVTGLIKILSISVVDEPTTHVGCWI